MSQGTEKFVEETILDILIPEASELNIEEALGSSNADANHSALIPTIPQRNLLFFGMVPFGPQMWHNLLLIHRIHADELISIYVVLRTPYQDEPKLKAYISRLAVALEAHAVSSASTDLSSNNAQHRISGGQARDIIWMGKVDTSEDPVIVVEEAEDSDDSRDMFLIWKLTAFLSRPRLRLQTPAILFKLSASLQTVQQDLLSEANDPFLPSGIPFPANLLQPLQDDPALKGMEPRLSALRLSRIPPSTHFRRPETLPLKVSSRRAVRAVSGISARVRYHRFKGSARNPFVTASLDIEIPSFTQHHTELKFVNLQFPDGKVDMIAKDYVFKLPMKCCPRDNIVFLYHLIPNPSFINENHMALTSKTLELSIDATVLSSPTCHPRIEMRWKTTIDFSTALNPDFGRPGPSMQRSSRPTNLPPLPAPPSAAPSADLAATSTSKMSSESQSQRQSLPQLPSIGITATFTSTSDVYIGEPFRWEIFIVNRSSKLRTLALIAVPKRNTTNQLSRPVSMASKAGILNQKDQVADAVLDENILYAVQKGQLKEATGLVCLSTEVRVGPLQPNACHTTSLKFLPLAKGPLHLEYVRIIDLASNEAIDVRDLPDVFAMERDDE